MIRRSAFAAAFLFVVGPGCRLGGGDMPRPAPQVLVTDSRSAFEMDPLLDVTLAPLDAGAERTDGGGPALAATPGPAATSYRATDAGVGAETPRDVSGPPQPQKPAAPPPLEKPRPPQATQSAQLPSTRPPAQSKPQPQPAQSAQPKPQPAQSAQPAPSQAPMPGMDHSAH